MIPSILGLGFLIGLQHALEADHVAAMSSIVSRRTGVRQIARHGAIWGVGHTLALLAFGGAVLVLKVTIDDGLAIALELGVGLMLVALGAHVLWRLWRDKVHFHAHSHDDGTNHIHAHSHRDDTVPHEASAHDHAHPERLPWRTLAVGLMHGMAGSAALIVLTAASLASPAWGLLYILLFGVGSILGMALLSAAIAVPLTYTARTLTVANRVMQGAIGLATIGIGAGVALSSAAAFGWTL